MDNYKGIYYNAPTESKSFEGGAHFRYKDLYRALSALATILPPDRTHKEQKQITQPIQHHSIKQNTSSNKAHNNNNIPSDNTDNHTQPNRRSRNKPSTIQGICITTVNPLPLQNTQVTYTHHTKNKLSQHVHTRQKSETNPSMNKNPLLFISNSNNKIPSSTYKIQTTKPKLKMNSNINKTKKIDLIQPIKTHSNSNNNKKKGISNLNKQFTKTIITKYRNMQQKNSNLNLSNINGMKSIKSRNNNQRVVTSPQNNKLSALTVNEISNLNKHSRNKHQQCNSLHGLTSISKNKTTNTFSNVMNLKRGTTKNSNNGMNSNITLHTATLNFGELFLKKKNISKK